MIDIIGSLKKAWDLAIHPSKATPMGIQDALVFYYSFAIIPAIIVAIIGAIFGGISGAAIELAIILILSPISFFVEAALIQLFGKSVFKKFTKPYPVTFTAVIIAAIPSTLFVWLSALTGGLAGILFEIWVIVLLTLAIMKLQKTSGLFAVLSWLIPAIILFIIAIIVGAALLTAIAPSFGGLGALQNGTLNSTYNITTTT